MQHLTMKATTTEVEEGLGQFTALVSAWIEDRMGDTITRDAYDKTIEAWKKSGRQMPLLFEHSTKAVGSIDPESMHTTDEGLVVSGEIDRSTPEGRQVWRQVKDGTVSFSIGFKSESRPLDDDHTEIYEIDLLEISATSTPVHPSARALSWKSEPRYEHHGKLLSWDEVSGGVEEKAEQPVQVVSFPC